GLLTLASTPREKLSRTAYNVSAFNPTAREICDVVVQAFPEARITWQTDRKRQAIVDSWPIDVNDGAARRDWGFAPRYDFRRAFDEYLIPTIRERYRNQRKSPVRIVRNVRVVRFLRARRIGTPRTT